MRYAGIIKNDFAAAPGVCTTFFVQGCPIHCEGCHNPQTWDFDGGKEFSNDTLKEIIEAICANRIIRNFCIMGGEPLCEQNLFLVDLIIQEVKKVYPNIKIYVWTGYEYEYILQQSDPHLKYILENINTIITGPFCKDLLDKTLFMRGSSNQKIIELKEI